MNPHGFVHMCLCLCWLSMGLVNSNKFEYFRNFANLFEHIQIHVSAAFHAARTPLKGGGRPPAARHPSVALLYAFMVYGRYETRQKDGFEYVRISSHSFENVRNCWN